MFFPFDVNPIQFSGKTLYDNMIDTLTWILKVVPTRFPLLLENFFSDVVKYNCNSVSQRPSRPSSVFYQIVERNQGLIVLANRNAAIPKNTVQCLFRMLSVNCDILFTHRNLTSSAGAWELKECCQWLCKSSLVSSLQQLRLTNH